MRRIPVWLPVWLSCRVSPTSVIAGRRCLNRVSLGTSTRWKSRFSRKAEKRIAEQKEEHEPLPLDVSDPSFTTGGLIFSEPRMYSSDVAGPPLSSEQQGLVDLILTGRNVFYSGAAGTGKSHVLRAAVEQLTRLGHRVHVVAPTGKAALAVNGITTWSYAGWTPMAHARPLSLLRKWALNKITCSRLANTDVLIIDEISMVENHHFKRLDVIMKEARGHVAWSDLRNGAGYVPATNIQRHIQEIRRTAFGGCQIIVTGDFFQLPPVLPFQHCIECGESLLQDTESGETMYSCPSGHGSWPESHKWAFQSDTWRNANFTHVELSQIYRQKGDPTFINILNRVRSGTHTHDDVMVLADPNRKTQDLTNAVRLFPTRFEVARHNAKMLRTLHTPSYDFMARDSFYWNEEAHPHLEAHGKRGSDGTLTALREDRYESFLRLKVGMPVILLTNLETKHGLVNGSQGVIIDFLPVDEFVRHQSKKKGMKISAEDEYVNEIISDEIFEYMTSSPHPVEALPVVEFENGKKRVIYPDCGDHRFRDNTKKPGDTQQGDSSQRPKAGAAQSKPTVLCRTQIPLTAGWAMSVHKAQGMSLGKVIVDLTRAFADGQVYVALSRAKSLDGLKVEGDPRGLFIRKEGNPDVRQFYREKFNHTAI